MHQRRLIKLAAPLLIAALALSACGDDTEEGGGGGDKVVKIGFLSPLSGDLSALGLGMRNSAQLAVDQANTAKAIPGWKIELQAEDDEAKGDVGATKATALAGDSAVAAVIGTLNSSVAEKVQKIFNDKNIAMISPANTNPTLTQGANPAAKQRPYASYFRVATTDAIQGPFAANYATEDLKATKVIVVHDQKTYGKGLAEAFAAQFVKNGGTVIQTLTVNPDDRQFNSIVSTIKAKNPDLVYYGGEYPASAPLSKQLHTGGGFKARLMGGDGMYSGTYITSGGAEVEGDFATSVGAPVEQLDSAKKFVTDYAAAGFKDPYEAYGAYTYDAANVIIEALKKALAGKDSVESARSAIIAAIQATSLTGATGAVSFDEFGDTTTKVLTVYTVKGGKWVPGKVGEFK